MLLLYATMSFKIGKKRSNLQTNKPLRFILFEFLAQHNRNYVIKGVIFVANQQNSNSFKNSLKAKVDHGKALASAKAKAQAKGNGQSSGGHGQKGGQGRTRGGHTR